MKFLLITLHLPHGSLLTGLRAAAGIWAAWAADIAAAAVRAALAPADPHQHEEEEDPQDHQADKHPLWKDAQRNLLEVALPPGHGIHGWVSPCKRGEWEGPGEERVSNQDGGAPDS